MYNRHRFLYRGKDNGTWEYGNLHICETTNHHHIINSNSVADECAEINLVKAYVHEVDPSTVGQCTGYAIGTTGVFIYKDDIVRCYDESTHEIIWRNGAWQLRVIDNTQNQKFRYTMLDDRIFYIAEIIGNIHDKDV
ncbi:MAG: YopX family protein [Defluviitaleaceae bacterium]|nr:YopX family protein [Defluviitaleaceae bacterium]MCL2261665.1 YopX family protein [Defluviitaleaceae bacterium]